MFVERSKVSRKTPKDGKLEITESAAESLRALAPRFDVVVKGVRGTGTLVTMTCTCRGADQEHTHHFVQSEAFKALQPDAEVSINLGQDADAVVVAENAADR